MTQVTLYRYVGSDRTLRNYGHRVLNQWQSPTFLTYIFSTNYNSVYLECVDAY